MPIAAPVAAPAIPGGLPFSPANQALPFSRVPTPTPITPNWSNPGPAGVPRVPAAPITPAPSPVPGGVARVGGGIGLAIGAASLGWAIGDGLRRAGVEQGLLDPEQSLYEWEKDDFYRRQNPSPIAPKQNVVPPGKAAPFTGGQCPVSYRFTHVYGRRAYTAYNTLGTPFHVPELRYEVQRTATGPISSAVRSDGAGYTSAGVYQSAISSTPGLSYFSEISNVSRVDGQGDNCGDPQPEPEPTYTPPRIQPLAPPILLPTAPGERPQNPRLPQRQPTLPSAPPVPQAPPVPAERPPRTEPAPNPGPAPAPSPQPPPQRRPSPTPGPQPQQQPQPPQPPAPPSTDICDAPCIGDILDGIGTIRDLLEQPPEPDPLDCDICAELEIIKDKIDAVKADTESIDGKVEIIDGKVDEIKNSLETISVFAPVVSCTQVTVNDALVWAHTVEQREFRVFSNVAEGFVEQLKEVAILTEAECKARNDKPPECVAIMPSDIYADFNLEGRLTIYFVKEEDWPKRSSSSSQWSIEVPNPKANLDWCRDFENFSVQKGNFNCREFWSDSGIRTGMHCASKDEGILFLNWVRTLTNATPLRRRFTEASGTRNPLYQGRIKVIRAVKTTIVNGVATNCVTYSRPANGCQ